MKTLLTCAFFVCKNWLFIGNFVLAARRVTLRKGQAMKIKYSLNGKTEIEIEVSDEVGSVIMESERREHNLKEKERSHCFSLELVKYEGVEFGYYDTYPALETDNEFTEKINYAFSQLTEVQKRRLFLYVKGLSMRKIAELENVSHIAVEKSVNSTIKKFKKFLK